MKVVWQVLGSIIILVGLLGAGWMLLRGDPGQDLESLSDEESEHESAGALQPVKATIERMSEEHSDSAEVQEEMIELVAVAPFEGSGVASRAMAGEVFVHEVRAKLAEPATGKFYEGWLVKTEPELTFFSTGMLEAEEEEESMYLLVYTAQEDFPGYYRVVITEETAVNGLDGEPEAHVLEGDFE